MHLDLKPENILVAMEGELGSTGHYKICDFGCSEIAKFSRMSGYQKSAFGTFNYLAPENHCNYQGQKTRSSADVWSLGVTVFEMVFWKMPFPTDEDGIMDAKKVEEFFNGKGPGIDFSAG